MKKFLGLLLVTLLISGGSAFAGDPSTKLGRGLTNIVTAPGEYVIRTIELTRDHDPVVSFFGGLVRGTFYTVGRALTGIYEVVTFPFPGPTNYEPLWEPATVPEVFQNRSFYEGGRST